MSLRDKKSTSLIQPHLIEHDPTYEAKESWYLSPEQLAVFRRCPASYRRQQRLGSSDDSAEMLRTSLRAQLGVIRTGKPDGATRSIHQAVLRMHDSVSSHAMARSLLSESCAGPVLRANYGPMPSQTRVDWLLSGRHLIRLVVVDSFSQFESRAWNQGDVHAVAFQRSLAKAVLGSDLRCLLLGVESREPFRCGLWDIDPDTLAIAERDNLDAIDRLIAFHTYDLWPTGYEQIRTLAVH